MFVTTSRHHQREDDIFRQIFLNAFTTLIQHALRDHKSEPKSSSNVTHKGTQCKEGNFPESVCSNFTGCSASKYCTESCDKRTGYARCKPKCKRAVNSPGICIDKNLEQQSTSPTTSKPRKPLPSLSPRNPGQHGPNPTFGQPDTVHSSPFSDQGGFQTPPTTQKSSRNPSSDCCSGLSDGHSHSCCDSGGVQVSSQSMPLCQDKQKPGDVASWSRVPWQRPPETCSVWDDTVCTHSDPILLPWKLTRRSWKCVLLRTGNGFLWRTYPATVIEWNDCQVELHHWTDGSGSVFEKHICLHKTQPPIFCCLTSAVDQLKFLFCWPYFVYFLTSVFPSCPAKNTCLKFFMKDLYMLLTAAWYHQSISDVPVISYMLTALNILLLFLHKWPNLTHAFDIWPCNFSFDFSANRPCIVLSVQSYY